jgi:hypothetical protein
MGDTQELEGQAYDLWGGSTSPDGVSTLLKGEWWRWALCNVDQKKVGSYSTLC